MVFVINVKSNNKLFETLESMGDFFLVPRSNNIILHTKLSRLKVVNRIKKTSDGLEDLKISTIKEDDITNYSPIIQSWYSIDKLESEIKKVSIKDVENEALNKLNLFIDSLEEELKKEESENPIRKEVSNCQIK